MSMKKRGRRIISLCKTLLLATPLFFTPHNREVVDPKDEYGEYILTTATQKYEDLDAIDADSAIDNSLEEKLGIRILGYPTKEDIDDLQNFYSDQKNRRRLFLREDMGLERVVIFPPQMRAHSEYLGKTVFDRNEIQFFSGQVNEHGVAHHEFTHLGVQYLEENNSPFLEEWKSIAGSYTHIEEMRTGKEVRYVYSKAREKQEPLFGYVTPYGGKSLHEDVATYVEYIVAQPEVFGKATESFDLYSRKLELLLCYEFITPEEFKKVDEYLTQARLKP
ncbi:hypothetical protein HYT55_01465 [Candidatus Woesearchaeota archaeon]|nr:hypothetical protein [Candidatus Woesearchaeota archaeon]